MSFLKQLYLLIVVISVPGKFLYAQVEKDYYSTHLHEGNLINTNRIYDCIYDQLGCLWLATDAGVSKYDGIEVTNYSTDDGLPDNDILQLYADNRGNIWMMCNNGKLCFFSSSDHKVYSSANLPFLSWIEDGSRIANIFQTSNGEFYISTSKQSYRINPFGKIARINVPQKQTMSKSNFFEMNGTVCFLTSDYLVNASNNTFQEHHLGFGKSLWISAVYYNNCIYANNRDSRLIKYYPESNTNTNYLLPDNSEIQSFSIINNCVVLATSNGVYSISNQDQSTKLFNITNATSVSFNQNHQSFALSTYDMGCIIYPDTSIQKLTFEKIAPDPYVTNVIQIDRNRTFLVHSSRYLSILNGNKFTSYSTNDIQSNRHIYSVIRYEDALSIITEKSWLNFNTGNQELKAVARQHNYKDQNIVLKHKLYLLTPYSLHTANLANGEIENSYLPVEEGNKYIDMEVYNGNILVLRSERFFILFDCINNQLIKSYSINELGLGKIFSFYIDAKNQVWLSMPQVGILNYDPTTGMCNYFPNTIKEDLNYHYYGNNECVLAFNNNFIFRYDLSRKDMTPVVYLPAEKINGLSLNGENLLVATSTGIVDISSMKGPNSSPVDYLNVNSITLNSIEQPIGPIKLTFDVRNQIDIGYTFIPGSYLNYDKPYFRILGFSEKWQVLDNRHVILPTLPSGYYVLEFGLTSPNGSIITQPTKIPIHILVPFWNRDYIKVMVVLSITLIFAIILIVILRINRLVRKKNESDIAFLKIEKKRAEAEYKAFFLQINPHFIFNTINNIKNIYNTGDIEKGNKYVQQFAKSMRNVLEFVDMNYISVEQEISYLTSYCDIFLFSIHFKYQFILESDDIKNFEIPPMIIQPFVENAIIHGLQNKTIGDRTLTIKFSQKGEENLLVEVIDNGVGRGFKKQSQLITKTSKGLEITQKRLELLNGDVSSNEYIKFIDLKDENELALGTKVQILIPIR